MGGRRLKQHLAATLAASALLSIAPAARADPARLTFDWGRFLLHVERFAVKAMEKPRTEPGTTDRAPISADPNPTSLGNAWFGVSPRFTFVARDWGGAVRLAGERPIVLDGFRCSQSTRMIMTRVRFGDFRISRVTPFLQLGVGQWRVDRNIIPNFPKTTEMAGQVGGGFELQITKKWNMAAEASLTGLYRDSDEASGIPHTRLWSYTVASRIEF